MRNGHVQRPDDRLYALPQPVREGPGGLLVLAGGADQGQFQIRAGEEGLGVFAGQPLIGDHRSAGCGAVGGLVLEHLPGLLAFSEQLGVGQAESGDGPVAGADEQQPGAPVPAGVAGAVAVPCPSGQVRAFRGDDRVPARDGRGVHQPQQLGATRRLPGQPAQRRLHQRRCRLDPLVVLALAQQPGEQVPDPPRRGTEPVPLIVIAQQDLRHGQAHQLGVGHLGRLARPAAAKAGGGDDPVGQFHVKCGQEGVQVGDHDGLQGSGRV
jgi:hypothetical protein